MLRHAWNMSSQTTACKKFGEGRVAGWLAGWVGGWVGGWFLLRLKISRADQ